MFRTCKVLQIRNIQNYSVRQASKLLNNEQHSMERTYEEIEIPCPWGKVVGKWWGPQDKRPILGIHGWQDNCGTFDRLAPYLPRHLGFFAIDVPGHGLSSKYPSGIFGHSIDLPILVRRIVNYFNWPKVSLLGHSMGAMCSFSYAFLYPENVDFLICIDGLYPYSPDKNNKPDRMAKTINYFLKNDALNSSSTEPPSYPFAQLEQLLHEGSRKSIDLESCKYLLQRNTAPSVKNPNLFYLTRDPRLKVAALQYITDEDLFEVSRRITCPVFISMATTSPFMQLKETYTKILEIIRKRNDVEYHEIEGTHHLHLNEPEKIEALVNAFIKKYDIEDRSHSGLQK